ncbi:hypothetical protein HGRIS_009283 [Hohenbuehelia grisea]|uniref:Uncharacterized protein n=1 Tax=Hohenbuehelia grisea TaxID=104357 RepID=A0ABR3J0N2_9AGAR
MSKTAPATVVSGFTVFPIRYSDDATHYMYARQHGGAKKQESNTKQALPSDRTLFLVNVPPDATDREVILFFRSCGTVEKVLFDGSADEEEESEEEEEEEDVGSSDGDMDDGEQPRKKRRLEEGKKPQVTPLPGKPLRHIRKTGQTAHVVFLDASSLPRALSLAQKPRLWSNTHEKDAPPLGLAHYTALYASLRPPLDAVRAHADTSIALYEYELAKSKQKSKYKKGEAIVDDDGFTLVTRGGAYGKTLGGGVAVASKRFQAARSGKAGRARSGRKEPKEKESFYAFQKAEKQRKGAYDRRSDSSSHNLVLILVLAELMDLKKNWEADKAKVEKLKASRRFRPY